MKHPLTPPNLQVLSQEMLADADIMRRIFSAASGPLVNDKYKHWDTLFHIPPPPGLTHEQWWFGLKIRRGFFPPGADSLKKVPLVDKQLNPFVFHETDAAGEILHRIDFGAGGLIQMREQVMNPEMKDQYVVSSLIEEAIASSRIEGASTTHQVAKEMIREGRPPRDRSERMIFNNFLTMERIGKLKERPLSRELVLELHALVTDETLEDQSAAGRLRRADEKIVVGDDTGRVLHEPPPADQLKDRMALMIDFANGKSPEGYIHPAIRSIILHFWLAYDHPFVDGNGRTARALFYWSMLRQGYWLFEFISISRIIYQGPSKYSRAFLYTETDDNDLTYFILYHLGVIDRAIEALHAYIERKTHQLQKLERDVRGMAELNHRQRALVTHAIRHPHSRYTIAGHRRSHNVVYETARRDLFNLRDRGLFEVEKVGKTYHFSPIPNLEASLAKQS